MSDLSLPPKDISDVISGKDLADKLSALIGMKFRLTNKPRTDGSTLRKIITKQLDNGRIIVADKKDFEIIPFKKKGVPKLLACLADSYIVTTGVNYNLQVWNRLPNTSNVLVKYTNHDACIRCNDIRFIFVQIEPTSQQVKTIIIATPQYIEEKFGTFGVPTIKHQLIISDIKRKEIVDSASKCLFYDDTHNMSCFTTNNIVKPTDNISAVPKSGSIVSLSTLRDKVVNSLLDLTLANADTKTRGQLLERIVANLLGYKVENTLVGGYPDIPNQLLEVKVQDSPTVDLGKYSPTNPVVINKELNLTTEDVRYLIALTDEQGKIKGIVLCPGSKLGESFTFVSNTNYKCQRSIPMEFFKSYEGKSIYNP